MPQFDTSTFFNQVTWVSLIFVTFYVFILYKHLPMVVSSIKVRYKASIRSGLTILNFFILKKNIGLSSDSLLTTLSILRYANTFFFIKDLSLKISDWISLVFIRHHFFKLCAAKIISLINFKVVKK